jgi:hypothetical protein
VTSSESSDRTVSSTEASEKDRLNRSDAYICTKPVSAAKEAISAAMAALVSDWGEGVQIIHLRGIWKLLHLDNFASASSDERLFLSIAAIFDIDKAIEVSSGDHWKCERILDAIQKLITPSKGPSAG